MNFDKWSLSAAVFVRPHPIYILYPSPLLLLAAPHALAVYIWKNAVIVCGAASVLLCVSVSGQVSAVRCRQLAAQVIGEGFS